MPTFKQMYILREPFSKQAVKMQIIFGQGLFSVDSFALQNQEINPKDKTVRVHSLNKYLHSTSKL